MKKVIIIGAGCGGITTGALLAKKGYNVTILEKNEYLGGRCSNLYLEGCRFDQGPSMYLLPEVFTRVLNELDIRDMKIYSCDPKYHIFDNGEKLTIKHGEAINEGKYYDFLEKLSIYYKYVTSLFFSGFFTDIFVYLYQVLKRIIFLDAIYSEYDIVSRYFESDIVKNTLTFASMYFGMSPYSTPAAFLILQYSEIKDGVFYPKGGMFEILKQIASKGEEYGMKIITNVDVKKIDISGKRKKVLFDNTSLEADIIISNVDASYTYSTLLNNSWKDKIIGHSLKNIFYSCSTISFYWVIDYNMLESIKSKLVVNNLFINGEYKKSFTDIFDRNTIPLQPSFYLNIPSIVDKTALGDGVPLVVLVPVGPLFEDTFKGSYTELIEWLRYYILNCIKTNTDLDLENNIIREELNTPKSWRKKFNLTNGSALGPSHQLTQSGFFRTPPISPYKDVYLIGSSVQLGIGVPTVMLSSLFLAQKIEEKNSIIKSIIELINYQIWSIYILFLSRFCMLWRLFSHTT